MELREPAPGGVPGAEIHVLLRVHRSYLVATAHISELRVEPAPFDLLLHHLPWGIGIVKMPWMPEPLYVEWPTP